MPHPLPDVATQLFNAAVDAADPAGALRRHWPDAGIGSVKGTTFLIAIGKAAPAMLREAMARVDGPTTAIALTHYENAQTIPDAQVLLAGHPVPDQNGARATAMICGLLRQAGPQDQVIALISGGGSALAPAPAPGVSLAHKAAVNGLLLESGLDIVDMNLVRQQLSVLKGGGFLRLADPAPVTAFILSDVVGDDLRAIASGPTVAPLGTAADALAILDRSGCLDRVPNAVRRHLETVPQHHPLPDARNILIGSNRHSVDAAAQAAVAQGWHADVAQVPLTGDVADAAGRVHAALPKTVQRPTALIFGGETTVVLRGTGTGGRNQELALRIALLGEGQPGNWVFLSGGTDGRDGPTDAAGGIVTAQTAGLIRAADLDPDALLANNDSHAALSAAGALLRIGATGTNVADVQIVLCAP